MRTPTARVLVVRFSPRIPCMFALIVAALIACGCDRDEPIAAYQAPKEQVRAPDSPRAQPKPIDWNLPEGWRALPGDGMRYAAFAVSADDPNLVVTVVPLGPNLPMLANINRWEGQIGLQPSGEGDLSKLLKPVEVNGETAQTIDIIGPEQNGKPKQRILAAIFERKDRTWYLKLQGDAEKVAAQQQKFDAFVKSVRFGEPQAGATMQAAPEANPAPTTPH